MKRLRLSRLSLVLASFAALLAMASAARAEEPAAAYVFPAGGQRGSEVSVRIGGYFFHGDAALEVLGDGIEAPARIREIDTLWFDGPLIPLPDSQRKEDYPRDHAAVFKIADQAEPGARWWRVATSQGATPAMRFIVGELPEVVERETDGGPVAVEVQLPVTINGRIFPRQDADIWTFTGKAGEPITCAVAAQSLGSPLAARLEVRDGQGRVVAEAAFAGRDPRLRFVPPADGPYHVHIHDVRFAGLQDHVYRLTITAGPCVDWVYPLGGRRGARVALELAGQQLPSEAVEVEIPADAPETFPFRPSLGGPLAGPLLLETSDWPELLEAEPNDEPAQAQAFEIPAVLNGRIDWPGDVDCWSFKLAKDERVHFDLRAARLGSPLDSVLVVVDAEGKELARNDDLAGGQTDSALTFQAPDEGTYFVRVEERFASRGGPDFAYRLHAARPDPSPDFRLRLVADPQRQQWADVINVVRQTPPDPSTEDDDAQQKPRRPQRPATLRLHVERSGGFEGEIELAVDGLPPGVTFEPAKVGAKAHDVQIRFEAAPEAKIGASRIAVRGSAVVGEDESVVTRVAEVPAMRRGDPPFDHVLLAVAMPTPFALVPEYKFVYAPRGSVYRRTFHIDRGGFAGPIAVRLGDRQARHLQGVRGPTIAVPPDSSTFDYPITLPPWMELGRTSRTILMLSGEVTDRDGSRHTVSFCSEGQEHQIVAIVAPGELSIETEQATLLAEPSGQAAVPVHVRRAASLPRVPVKIELVPPDALAGMEAEPVVLGPDQADAVLLIKFSSELPPTGAAVVLRATALDSPAGQHAETTLELVRP